MFTIALFLTCALFLCKSQETGSIYYFHHLAFWKLLPIEYIITHWGEGKTIDVNRHCAFLSHSTVHKEVTEKFIILFMTLRVRNNFFVVPCLSFDFIVEMFLTSL